ncbi:LysR family transcriptional regulator [Pseudomonas sp. Pdm06]|uniref:LysR family transcriptional regulator n=1 Tax=Pseudomonas sp. Pdm06 TaxID=1790044 RepID=UPI001780DE38|nr:LysR family transcriptional regulator [Pseudomonas sp. Pdm06]MBD9466258.1 LysR family transcriptional regulator [Pseudomonas sp. Pdm06]
MDLHQLRHFLALAEHGNFTRAAEATFITQSAFSRSIQALEQNLGCQLVERGTGGRGFALTAQGRALRVRAREIIDEVSSLRADILGLEQEPAPLLSLGCGPLPAARLVPAALAEFVDLNRDTRIDLRVDAPDVLKECLDNGEIEFLIADLRHIETSKGYVTQALRPRRFQLFCRRHHPLQTANDLSFRALADYPLACSSLPAELRVLLSERAGRDLLPINMECKHTDILIQMVTSSDLVGIAAEDVVAHLVSHGIVERLSFVDAPQGLLIGGTCFGVVYRADRRLSRRAMDVIETIGRIDATYIATDLATAQTFDLAI